MKRQSVVLEDETWTLAVRGAAWMSSLTFDSVPVDVIESTKLRVLDVIGNTIAASRSPFGATMRRAAKALSGNGPSRILGFGDCVGSAIAALANGSMGTALDFDDTHTATILHFSTPTVVTALASPSTVHGRDVLTAVAGGSELMCRIGMSAPGEFHRRGYHATGILGAVGAAYTASYLLRLPQEATANAVAIAAAHTAGLTQAIAEGKNSRHLCAGWAAQLGVAAATMAQAGLAGPEAIFEGERGLLLTHVGSDAVQAARGVLDGLGSEWETRRSSFKGFPCGHVIHPFIQAALALRGAYAIDPGNIEKVICRVPPYAVPMVCEPAVRKKSPCDDNEARISLQYTVAETLSLGRLDGNSYQSSSLRNSSILALASRVDCIADPAFASRERYGGKMTITMKDGSERTRTELCHWGSPELPIASDDVRKKFLSNVTESLSDSTASSIIETTAALERQERIGDLVDLCCARPAGAKNSDPPN